MCVCVCVPCSSPVLQCCPTTQSTPLYSTASLVTALVQWQLGEKKEEEEETDEDAEEIILCLCIVNSHSSNSLAASILPL